MEESKVLLRWIPKIQRKKTQIKRVRAAAFLIGYASGYVERIEGRDCPYMGENLYRRYIDYGYGKILNKNYNANWEMLEEFCESLIEEYSPFDEYPTLKRFLFYACDIIEALSSYISISHNDEDEDKALDRRRIKTIMESLHSPKAGAIARRAFVEAEKALREITEEDE